MINFQPSKICFFSTILLSVCFLSPALADDVVTPDILPDGQLSTTAPTPQPPLIDQTQKTHYEPKNIESAETINENKVIEDEIDDEANDKVGDKTSSTSEPPTDNTPQPPLVDPQQPTNYEPETSIDSTQENNTSAEPMPNKIPGKGAEKKPEQATDIEIIETTNSTDTLKTETKEKQTSWTDTRPQRVSADWLQLTSGEWLRGRIIIMQKEKLEFDSDELNNLEIDWKKVKYIKSSEPYSLRFDDKAQATGAIEITQSEIRVTTDYDDQRFKRSELLSIASGHETEISKWTNKITFSINARRGNTNQTDFSAKINAKRRTVNSRLLLEYLGSFTEIENTKTINNHRLNFTYDIFLNRDLFITPMAAEFFRDPFQNIEQRANIGIAVGYTIINSSKSEWDISGGPAYQETKFVSVQPGQDSKDATATLILTTKFDTELNSKVDLEGTYSITLGDSKTGGYTHRSILTIETELTKKLDFDVTGIWDRIKSPVQDQNGIVPERDDFRILVGLGYDL